MPTTDVPKRFELQGLAQGTTYSVIYYAADSVFTKAQCDSVLISLDNSLSIYKQGSRINALNQTLGKFTADDHLLHVLRKGQQVAKQTDGAFDMTVLPLVQAWGFGAKEHRTPPDSLEIAQLKQCVGMNLLRIRSNNIIKKKRCVQVDVNGIAQGYSVDVLARVLESKGVHDYLVEIGGEMRIKGKKMPTGDPFTIGIESPEGKDDLDAPMQRLIQVPNGAVTTSGNYRRYYVSGGKTITHLLNPATGFPVQNHLISVTVWAPDAITADALDNALMVMGMEKGLQFTEAQKEVEAYFIYIKKDGTVNDTATKAFYQFFKKE